MTWLIAIGALFGLVVFGVSCVGIDRHWRRWPHLQPEPERMTEGWLRDRSTPAHIVEIRL